MEEEKNLIPFSQYYPLYGDDKVTPLTYRIGGRRVPESLYNTMLVDPNTGQVVMSEADQRALALAPVQDALDVEPGWKEKMVMDFAPVLDGFKSLQKASVIFDPIRVANYNRLSPEAKKALWDGGNLAGNAVMLPFTVAMGLGAVEGLVSTANLAKMAYAAGNYAEANSLIGSIIGAIAGGKIGHDVGDAAIRNITGGQYAGFADYLNKNAGIYAFNSEMMNPFTIGSGYAGSYALSGLAGNWRPSVESGRAQQVVTPEGAQEIPFGEQSQTVSGRFAEAPNAVGGSSTRTGVMYNRSAKGGFNRTSGQARQVDRKGGPRQQGKTTGVKGDRLSDNRSKNQNETSPKWSVTGGEQTPFVPVVGNTIMPFPPPHVPPTVPPFIQEPEKHLEEVSRQPDSFPYWFQHQKPGTVVYWPGDSNSGIPAGPKKIVWSETGPGFIDIERTRQGVGRPDNQGRKVGTPAKSYGRSQRVISGPWNPNKEHWVRVTEEEGALPNVELDYNEAPIIYYPDQKY